MATRQLHPTQKRYYEVKDKIEALEITMLPLKNEMKSLRKQLLEAEKALMAWTRKHFPASYTKAGYATLIDLALHIDATSLPPDEPTTDQEDAT